ncbi:hypothetical protein IVA80_15200 [Bradyrhizobium sp. 139]|uniref:hypothetical protein n=1 Tax=Bradyrhizobium sp. 139 TaxID=2782616 RepID=UPI001FFABE7A|nr:hypothetical protein [Bradyrhizobium sp. 139]MCK1742170.1 hypothetical protein [Bradyrhizobium sp. 139]
MEQIGYSLVDASGAEVWHEGETAGVLRSIPQPVLLPNGDAVHCAQPGQQYGDWRFVERWLSDAPPSPFYAEISRSVVFDGSKVVVIVGYEASPSIVPQSVTPRQARLALLGAGLLDQVESTVTAAGGATYITWGYATEFLRSDPLIVQIGASLGLTDQQIDDLFRTASTL